MVKFSQCRKADILDRATKRMIKAAVSFGAMDSLLITVPQASALPTNEPVLISFLDAALGVVRCRCRLSAPLVSDNRSLCTYRCQILEYLSQKQRREDLKIPMNVNVAATLVSSGDMAAATIRDISAGGAYLVTTLAAQVGEQLTFSFRQAGTAIPLTAEVLRAEATVDQQNRLVRGYGCRFVHLSPQHEAQLRSYIFQEEKRRLKG